MRACKSLPTICLLRRAQKREGALQHSVVPHPSHLEAGNRRGDITHPSRTSIPIPARTVPLQGHGEFGDRLSGLCLHPTEMWISSPEPSASTLLCLATGPRNCPCGSYTEWGKAELCLPGMISLSTSKASRAHDSNMLTSSWREVVQPSVWHRTEALVMSWVVLAGIPPRTPFPLPLTEGTAAQPAAQGHAHPRTEDGKALLYRVQESRGLGCKCFCSFPKTRESGQS